jgi:hypothetical protein
MPSVLGSLLLAAALADIDTAIVSLLPEVPALTEEALPAGISTAQHAEALAAHATHGERFWVRGVSGDPDAERVVFIIPQYHRNITMPIAWTTLGREIAEVQQNIDTLVRVLATRHHLTCIGTEGTTRRLVSHSSELRQLAWWQREIDRGREVTRREVARETERAVTAVDASADILTRVIAEHAVYLDGVGAAQSRLAGRAQLSRFGIEEDGTHTDALALLDKLKAVEEKLALVDPGTEPEGAGVVGRMWLDEYPAYQETTLEPLAVALQTLEGARRQLRRDGFAESNRVVGAWTARVRRIAGALIQPEELAATHAYYRELESKSSATRRELSAAAQQKRARLLARRATIYARYEEITRRRREQAAAQRVIDRMTGTRHRRCAVVMGAGHEEALVRELRAAADRVGLGPIGLVTVAPFHFE